MTKHTQPPWTAHVFDAFDGFRIEAIGKNHGIAGCNAYEHEHCGGSFTRDELAANALLISAAPELFNACASAIEAMGMHGPCKNHSCAECKKAWRDLHAAINKAKGAQ